MGTPNYPKDMASEWNSMTRAVKNAFTSANLRTGMAKIGAKVIEITGSLVMNAGAELAAKYTNGVNALELGQASFQGNPVGQLRIKRFDGTDALQIFGGEGVPGYFSINDRNNNIIISDDSGSGQGLARPWLEYTITRTSAITNPVDKNTTTSFAAHHSLMGYMQHPKIQIRGFLWMAAGDTGEVRLRSPMTGNVVASSGILSSSAWVTLEAFHENYSFGDFFQYDLEVRRATGTGAGVGFTPIYAYGKQT